MYFIIHKWWQHWEHPSEVLCVIWEIFQAFILECYIIWLQMSSQFDNQAVQLVKFGVLRVLV
jgi:tRNA U34 5-methylaminomethyl-2-thiouridine-forming methyltransferase MnmC